MTFLSLNGTTIPCASDQTKQSDEEHRIDRGRMFDGVIRMSRQGVYRMWTVTTNLLTESDANSILALIRTNNPPLLASGDLVGSDVAVMPIPGGDDPIQTATGFRRRVTFTLKETGGPLPADKTAVPYALYRRGVGYLTGTWLYNGGDYDLSACTAAGEGDRVSVWRDQSGNGFDLLAGVNQNFNTWVPTSSPTLQGDKLYGGFFSRPGNSGWWTALTQLDILAGVECTDSAPASNGTNVLWEIGGSGATGVGCRFPAVDGHLYDTVAVAGTLDLGAPVVDLSALVVYNVTIDLNGASPNWTARLNNTIQHQETQTDPSYPYLNNPNVEFGASTNAGTWFDGWWRDLVIFNGILTPTQRRSWYDYGIGAVADPPLP